MEELIKQCGDNLYIEVGVEVISAGGSFKGCQVKKFVDASGNNAQMYYGKGKTVEEALGNLLLELNK